MSWQEVLRAAGYWDGGGLLRVPTSGTSAGAPRVVLRTVRSWADSFEPFAQVTGIESDDVVLAAGPATSLFVYARAQAAAVGAAVIDRPRWHVDHLAGATVAHLTPTMLGDAVRAPRLPLRLAIVAGAGLSPTLREQAVQRGIDVVEYYGATELSVVALGRGALRPFPSVEVESREGVLWARSPWTALGYAEGQDGPLRRDGDWCTVGDTGMVRAGRVQVQGRGDVVTTGGTTVRVGEVTAALRDAPGVTDCAVLGMPHGRLGEVVTAVVVGGQRRAVLAHCRATLIKEQRPVQWFTADRLPVAPTGKLGVTELQAAIDSGEVRRWI